MMHPPTHLALHLQISHRSQELQGPKIWECRKKKSVLNIIKEWNSRIFPNTDSSWDKCDWLLHGVNGGVDRCLPFQDVPSETITILNKSLFSYLHSPQQVKTHKTCKQRINYTVHVQEYKKSESFKFIKFTKLSNR